MDMLRKVMAVQPSLYDHNWDSKGELLLSVPMNINQLLHQRANNFKGAIRDAKELPLMKLKE